MLLLPLKAGDCELGVGGTADGCLGLVGGLQVDLFAIEFGEGGLELLAVLCGESAENGPILAGLEVAYLSLAFDYEAKCDGLDAPGAEAAVELFPEKRAELVADDAVEYSAGLLGVDLVEVDVAGGFESVLDGGGGNFVEGNAAYLFLGQLEGLGKVPGDGLAFPVGVWGEVYGLSALAYLSELLEDGALPSDDGVAGLEACVDVDAEFLCGKVAHVPATGFDRVALAEDLLYCLCLGR